MELDREDFDTEEAYQAEKERLRLKYEEARRQREEKEKVQEAFESG